MTKLKINKCFFLFVVFLSAKLPAQTEKNQETPKEINLFGVRLNIQTQEEKDQKILQDYVSSRVKNYSSDFDPDCYYKEYGNKDCGGSKPSADVIKLTEDVAAETKNIFQLIDSSDPKKPKKDFGGIAQGLVLDEVAKNHPSIKWFGNFAGDIYYSEGYQPDSFIYLTDPQNVGEPFAILDMSGGWVISSVSPEYGGRVRKEKKKYDFEKIVLFANPSFNGGRLDGWSTALIEGGVNLLRHLKTLKKFEGQWAYLYFHDNGKVFCSPDISCSFKPQKQKIVKVKWKNKKETK